MKKITNPILMHINYFEQGQSIEYTVRKAKAMGYDGIEFRRVSKTPVVTLEDYIDEIARCLKLYGMEHVVLGAPYVSVLKPDEAENRASIDAYKHFLDMASEKLNLKVINLFMDPLTNPNAGTYEYDKHGSAYSEPWQWEKMAKACQEIADYAPQLRFAFETHMNYLHDLASTARKLTDMIDRPNMGINLDYGNTVGFPAGTYPTVEECIDICSDKLFYNHWKNSIPGYPRRIRTALSQGDINHRAYLKKLHEVGYKGYICLEAPRSGDREYFAVEDLAYMKSLIADFED